MTDTTEPVDLIVYQRTDAPGQIYGVPNHDLTQRDWDALWPNLRREVKASALYAAVPSPEVLDPLGELDNAAFEALLPHEKGARTRRANELREEAERAEAERLAEIERLRAEQAADATADVVADQDAGDESGQGDN